MGWSGLNVNLVPNHSGSEPLWFGTVPVGNRSGTEPFWYVQNRSGTEPFSLITNCVWVCQYQGQFNESDRRFNQPKNCQKRGYWPTSVNAICFDNSLKSSTNVKYKEKFSLAGNWILISFNFECGLSWWLSLNLILKLAPNNVVCLRT